MIPHRRGDRPVAPTTAQPCLILRAALAYDGAMIYDGVPLETLRADLALAQAALPLLERGESLASLGAGDKRLSFVPTEPDKLRVHIAELQRAIYALEHPGYRPRGYAVASFAE